MSDRGYGSMGWMGMMRRPSVQTTETIDIPTQFWLPLLKALGAGIFYMLAFVSLGYLAWITPAGAALDVAWVLTAAGAIVLAIVGIANCQTSKEGTKRTIWLTVKAVYAFLLVVLLGTVSWYFMRLPTAWWKLAPPWPRAGILVWLEYGVGVFGLSAGILGAYIFTRETILTFELTGLDRVLMRKFEAEQDWKEERTGLYVQVEELTTEVRSLELDLTASNSRPLVNAAEVSNHQRQPLLWQLAVAQLLLAGEMGLSHTQNGLVPGGSPVHTLPLTSTRVTDALVKHVYRNLRTIKVADMPVMTSAGNKTGFTPGVPIMLAVGAIERVPVLPGFS